ncbi:hypothetical protein L0U85_08660 [Glycomyces sp. L485]|uniref:hypothetical protein n=1 Tax=Glycomyces sp. L485 TaxID=2909235 RepID=UPI001F4B8D60|nr:hypothetical protein [Glycomyces sp. L485]MCH7230919.1 hypothetical protein [Glycomyces sp. L485]
MSLALPRMSTRVALAGVSLTALVAAGCSSVDSADAAGDTAQDQTREAVLKSLDAEMNAGASGEAVVTVDDGTGVELAVSGLMPETDYTSHLHDGTCKTDPPGGGHWMADPEGEMSESNEIHLHFTTDADGSGSVTVASDLVADDRVKAIVVHVVELESEGHDHMASDRVLCGDFD